MLGSGDGCAIGQANLVNSIMAAVLQGLLCSSTTKSFLNLDFHKLSYTFTRVSNDLTTN